ncbi:MAG: thermonuclease family protein, partial [Rhodoglobus sp.]
MLPQRPPVIRLGIALAIIGIIALGWFALNQNDLSPNGAQQAAPGEATPGTKPAPVARSIPPEASEATVEYVHDGDTLFLADGRKVRMLGINTPEIGENRECYGEEATALLRRFLPVGTKVWVVADVRPEDQYGRSLLFVYQDDATNVNLEMLRQGAAEVEMYSPNLLLEDEIEAAERA